MNSIKVFEQEVEEAFYWRNVITFKALYLYSKYMQDIYYDDVYYDFMYKFIYNEIKDIIDLFIYSEDIHVINFFIESSIDIIKKICNEHKLFTSRGTYKNFFSKLVENDNIPFVRFLLEKHIIVEQLIIENQTILYYIKSIKMLKLLCDYGLEINTSCYIYEHETVYFDISPLYDVLFDKKFDNEKIYSFVKTFLELGSNPNYIRDRGSFARPLYDTTPLMVASYKYSYKDFTAQKLIVLLLQYGAKTDIKDAKGKTIFHYLIERSKYNVINIIKYINIIKLIVYKEIFPHDLLRYLKTFLY